MNDFEIRVFAAVTLAASALRCSPLRRCSPPRLLGATHGGSASAELNVVGQFEIPVDGLTTDVWAYGNYAYVGSFDEPFCSLDLTGVRVIDISNPTAPEQVTFIPAKPGTRNNDVKVEHIETRHFTGEILVLSNEPCGAPFNPRLNAKGGPVIPGQGGLAIWDVTDPTNPKPMKQNFLKFGVHNTFIYQQGDNAYMLVVDDENVQDLTIVDITKPRSPKVIAVTGQLDWETLDSSEIEGAAEFLHDVWVQENTANQVIAYLSYWDAGLVLLDITDPTAPVFLGDSTYPDPDVVTGLKPEGNAHVAARIRADTSPSSATRTSPSSAPSPPPRPASSRSGLALFGPDPLTFAFWAGDVIDTGGLGCSIGDVPPAPVSATPQIALIERGVCFFSTKAANAEAQGYDAYIVFNSVAGGEGIIDMVAGTPGPFNIPGIFLARSRGGRCSCRSAPPLRRSRASSTARASCG